MYNIVDVKASSNGEPSFCRLWKTAVPQILVSCRPLESKNFEVLIAANHQNISHFIYSGMLPTEAVTFDSIEVERPALTF